MNMKITDILNTRNMSLSFEVFPPKKETSFETVKSATEEIAGYRPSFMSVTYGAGGGTSRFTLDIAKNIKEKFNVPTLAHLTCVSSSKQTVHEQIDALRNADIKNTEFSQLCHILQGRKIRDIIFGQMQRRQIV